MNVTKKVFSYLKQYRKLITTTEIWENLNKLEKAKKKDKADTIQFIDVQDALTSLIEQGIVDFNRKKKNPRYKLIKE